MENKEFNIKSSTIEKGLDLAKEFLGKLISPTIEEVGLLIADNIKFLRFKNQINILLKAQKYVAEKKVPLQEIPIKILVPLLENASLEENEELQDKWAKMIVNLADSEKNFQNQIFPYLLGQISLEEFEGIKELLLKEAEFAIIREKYAIARKSDQFLFQPETKKLKDEVDKIEQGGFVLFLEEFETANLLRLGLIKLLPPKIYIEEFSAGGREHEGQEQWFQLDASYYQDTDGFRITDLGRKFINVCELEGSVK